MLLYETKKLCSYTKFFIQSVKRKCRSVFISNRYSQDFKNSLVKLN